MSPPKPLKWPREEALPAPSKRPRESLENQQQSDNNPALVKKNRFDDDDRDAPEKGKE